MRNKVKAVPEGFHTVTPYLILKGVSEFIKFLEEAFDAETISRMDMPDGTVGHAQVKIGDSFIMMGEAGGEWKPMQSSLFLYVEDADKVYNKAVKAGAVSLFEPKNEFYGDRMCGVTDAFGNQWWIATHIEDVSEEEMQKREKEWIKEKTGK